MNDVKLPIETTREGNKITKVCVEDVYKLLNRVYGAMDKAYNKSSEVMDKIHKDYGEYEGELIIGKGISQPCLTDTFDEEIGMNIAFMKAKLNANIKKHNFLVQVYNNYLDALDSIYDEISNVDDLIMMDLNSLRIYNPEYLKDSEYKLGILD